MSDPLVSVVIPTFNRVGELARAVDSVLTQTLRELELIIVDDASSDATPDYLENLVRRDGRVRYVRTAAPGGGASARNAGIALCRGLWIAFLDDDDVWRPEKLERQIRELDRNPHVVAGSCCYVQHFPDGSRRNITVPHGVTLQQVLERNVLGGASVCICDAGTLRAIGGFDAALRSGQDWDLWVRLLQVGRIAVCRERLVDYFIHDRHRISSNVRSALSGTRRFHLKHRRIMNEATRRRVVAMSCYLRACDASRRGVNRSRYLCLAIKYARLRTALAYLKNAGPTVARAAWGGRK